MDFSTKLGQMLMLLLMMILGYLARRQNLLDEHVNASLSKVVLNVTLPAQIITSFAMEGAELTNGEVGAAFGLSCLIYLFYTALAVIYVRLMRLPRQDWGTYQYMIIFGNIGFMGFPVITAIFGAKALVYAVIMNIVFNLLVFSYGIKLITDGSETAGSFSWRKLINMPLISSALTLVLFFLHIKLPTVVNTALFTMGDATTPMAMLILGCTIAEMPLRELFDEWRVYIFTAVKLLAMPLLVFLLLQLLPGFEANSLLGKVLVVLSSVPVATNATMLSIEYGGNNKLVAQGIFFSTIFSVLTIPLLVFILY